jgi:methionine-rich copper-binding protein CopC
MKPWFLMLAPLIATPAFAHAMLEQANPAAGAVLNKAPKEIVLRFSEPLEGAFSSVALKGPDGAIVATTSHASDRTMRTALKALAPGKYRVTWRAVSVDTHHSEGSFTFTIKP